MLAASKFNYIVDIALVDGWVFRMRRYFGCRGNWGGLNATPLARKCREFSSHVADYTAR